MDTVTSADGTRIGYDRNGDGPAIILVSGALGHRGFDPLTGGLLDLLAPDFSVYFYDRRGRGDSTDTHPYAVEREIEDIAALIEAAGGEAYAYGLSSGGVLALRAAQALPAIAKLAMYEPPFIIDDSRPPLPSDYVEQVEQAVAEGRRGDAVEILMTKAIGVPVEYLAHMRQDPSWSAMEAVAHTISYDGRTMGTTMSGRPLPAEWAQITTQTLVLDGGMSEQFMHDAANALADLLPNARRHTLADESHAVDPKVLAPVLAEFFGH